MTLTQSERDLVVEWLFNSETAFLVETIMDLLPYEDAKKLADSLKEDDDEIDC